MSLSNAAETGLWNLIFNNTAFVGIGDAGGLQPSAAAGSFYVSLHTADPGEAGTQLTSEATYGSYARVAVARNSGALAVSGDTVSNVGQVQFPESTSGTNVITHWALGSASSGAGIVLVKGALGSSKTVNATDQPQFGAGALTATIN